jgi:hypothetical protein
VTPGDFRKDNLGAVVVERYQALDWRGEAAYSPDERYRYRLLREWDKTSPRLLFVMLNPSKATAERSDGTVTRCIEIAKRFGFGSLAVANIFALRSTDPKALYVEKDPIGELNDLYIKAEALSAAEIICAWGTHGELKDRGREALGIICSATAITGAPIKCLKRNADNSPHHPLRLSKSIVPELYCL